MKLSIYFGLCLILSVAFKKCNEQKDNVCGVKINELSIMDIDNIIVDTTQLTSKLKLSTTLHNPDSIMYENLIIKLYAQTADTTNAFQKTLFATVKKNKIETQVYEMQEKDSLKCGKFTFFAELYNDSTLLDKKSQSLIVVKKDTIKPKQNRNDTSFSTNTIIATNPEYYSFQTNSADYNTPLFFEIRIQQNGETIENNLTVQYSVSDSTSIQLLGNKKQVIPIIYPESPALILNNCSFKIIKPCRNNAVGITVTLLKENTLRPTFSKTYWMQVGSIIEKRKK